MKRVSPLQDSALLGEAISNTESISDALIYLGLRAAGGNYAAFHRACQQFNLIPKLGTGRSQQTANAQRVNIIPLKDILTINSTYNRYYLKRRLLRAGLLEEICSVCGLGPWWNGQKLTLQIDHINGIYNDNRLENLRVLCPNCHTQTKTFAGRSRKVSRLCPKCKIYSKSRSALTCARCYYKTLKGKPTNRNKATWPDSNTLHQMVQDSSYVKVGRVLGVTDKAVAKRLINYPPTD